MDQNSQPAAGRNQTSQNGEKKVGPIISTLVIVLVLIIAALYLFASRVNRPSLPTDASNSASQPASVQPVTSTSTNVQSLQNDLNSATAGLDNQNF